MKNKYNEDELFLFSDLDGERERVNAIDTYLKNTKNQENDENPDLADVYDNLMDNCDLFFNIKGMFLGTRDCFYDDDDNFLKKAKVLK